MTRFISLYKQFAGLSIQKKTLFVGVFAIASVGVTSLTVSAQDASHAEPQQQVSQTPEFFTLDPRVHEYDVTLSGTLEAQNDAVLSAEQSGIIDRLVVQEGDLVQAGQLVAVLDHDEIDARLARAQAAYEQAKAAGAAQVDTAQSAHSTTNVTHTTTQENTHEALMHAYENGIQVGSDIVSRSTSALITLSDIQELQPGNSTLYDKTLVAGYKENAVEILIGAEDAGYFSGQFLADMDGGLKAEFRALAEQNEVSLAKLTDQLSLLRDGLRKALAAFDEIRPAVYQDASVDESVFEGARTQIENDIGLITQTLQNIADTQRAYTHAQQTYEVKTQTTQSALEHTRAQTQRDVEEALRAVRELEIVRAKRLVHAPFSGTVAEKFASRGELVQQGTPIFSLVGTDSWKVELSVPDRYNESLVRGTEVAVVIDGVRGTYTGTVRRILPRIDTQTRKVRIEVEVDNLPETARAGLFARVMLSVAGDDAFAVPRDVIEYGYDGPVVRTRNNSIAVTIVRETEDGVFIHAPELSSGMELIRK